MGNGLLADGKKGCNCLCSMWYHFWADSVRANLSICKSYLSGKVFQTTPAPVKIESVVSLGPAMWPLGNKSVGLLPANKLCAAGGSMTDRSEMHSPLTLLQRDRSYSFGIGLACRVVNLHRLYPCQVIQPQCAQQQR